MRWLLALVVIALAGQPATAKIVIMEPPLARACETAGSWPKLMECMAKHGLRATIVRSLDGAKLVKVTPASADDGRQIEAFAIYVEKAKSWKLGGMLRSGMQEQDVEVVQFERITLGTKHGFRFDIASSQGSFVSLDSMTSISSQLRQVQATFCNGTSYNCLTIVPQCTQLVEGQAYIAFAGRIELGENQVKVVGAGTPQSCSSAGVYNLALVE
ncbi:MAG: hypothetical protein ABI678_05260 [Kofleriaceae bacterium]